MRHYSDSPGSIYPALRRLAERGLIKAEPKDRRGREGLPRYAGGLQVIRRLARTARDARGVVLGLEELMLRFALWMGMCRARRSFAFLSNSSTRWACMRRSCAHSLRRDSKGNPLHTGLLAFQAGVEGMEAHLRWARKARARMKEKGK